MALPKIIKIENKKLFEWSQNLRSSKTQTIFPTIDLEVDYESKISLLIKILGKDSLRFADNTFEKTEEIVFNGRKTFCFEWEVVLLDDSIFGNEAKRKKIRIPDICPRSSKTFGVNEYNLAPGKIPIALAITASDEEGQEDSQIFYIEKKVEVLNEVND